LAVVTHAGGKPLEEPYVIRPTSETIIGYFFKRWIESWRDLPLLINQWANVMRWELRTRMFLRTGEFLWQEGHTAHATHEEAKAEVRRMLDVYATFCEEWMAMPVIQGVKTDSERFAGAVTTTCVEAMMQDGKALQAGTSHDLGQNFGRAFDVKFQNKAGAQEYVWQTSWGVSTRLVGALIMTHSDDEGLVLPPRLAPIQVAVVPILGKGDDARVLEYGESIRGELVDHGFSVRLDTRDHKPGFKFYEWEQKGVPLRIEIGPRDVQDNGVAVKERTAQRKDTWSRTGLPARVEETLAAMQRRMLDEARARRDARTVNVDSFTDFKDVLHDDNKFIWAHWDGSAETEARVKEETKATIRCIPFGDGESGRCMVTGRPSPQRVLFARNY
jgi:prolyl-tRNA synthetase